MKIDRREAVARLAALTGTVILGAEFFVSGCARTDKKVLVPFTPADVALLDEIGETILPVTDTPGAKAVAIGSFMVMMVTDCYDEEYHAHFQHGLLMINQDSRRRFGRDFLALSPSERTDLLNALEREQRAQQRRKKPGDLPHYFQLMRELTLLGFFTSEVGCTQVQRFVENPGSYDGDVPYHRGDRTWANPSPRMG